MSFVVRSLENDKIFGPFETFDRANHWACDSLKRHFAIKNLDDPKVKFINRVYNANDTIYVVTVEGVRAYYKSNETMIKVSDITKTSFIDYLYTGNLEKIVAMDPNYKIVAEF